MELNNKDQDNIFNIINSIKDMPGHLYCKDKDGAYLWCNQEQLNAVGFTDVSQVLGKTDFDLCEYNTALAIRNTDIRIMAKGMPEVMEEKGNFCNVTTTISYKAPLKNSKGEIIGIIGNSINISTQTVVRESIIKEHHSKNIILENIVAGMPGYIYWKDLEGKILGCNDKQAQVFNFKNASDLIGKTAYDLYNDRDSADLIQQNDLYVVHNGKAHVVEEPGVINGQKHVFLSHKAPLRDPSNNEIIGVLGVSIDITHQKELEQALSTKNLELTHALDVKRDFLNNMSHEVRTPLTSLVSMTEVLESCWDELTEEKKKECLKDILNGRDRLMSLLSNLLDLSKFQQGKATFQFKYHDVKILIIEVVDEFKNISHPIDLHISSDVDTHISCDEGRLKQVIRNLIANSVKHGGENKPISITISEDDKNSIKVSVSDEAVGIPEDELENIFNPFVESKRTKRMSGGTGMGLSLCKDIITGHKGKIWAENNKSGIGSTFHFTLPYETQSPSVYTFRLTRKS